MKSLVAALALLLSLTLAGCGGGSDPVDPPSSPTSAPQSPPTTGPVAPTPPVGTYDRTKAGVIKFAKYYWTVVDYAQKTGDTTTLRTLEYHCASCKAGREWIEKIYRRHGSIDGGGHRVVGSSIPYFRATGAGVVLRMRTTTQVVANAGDMSRKWRGGADTISMAINEHAAVWRVTDWRVL
ncbi:DUF6318 family protein [Nocardioides montaniterrae]